MSNKTESQSSSPYTSSQDGSDTKVHGSTPSSAYTGDFKGSVRFPNRKIINKPKPNIEIEYSNDAPDLQKMITDGMSIISAELAQYRHKTAKGKPLDLKEARVVNSYMETLTKIAREARESAKPEMLQNLSDEQLMELVMKSYGEKNVQSQPKLETQSQDKSLETAADLNKPKTTNGENHES